MPSSPGSDPPDRLRAEIREHFERLAPRYDRFKEQKKSYYRQLKRLYSKDFAIPPGSRVLEIGCGTGEILAALRPGFGLGIDLSREMIRIARRKFAARPELHFLHAEAEELPLLPGKFDWIIAPDVLEHLHDLRRAVRELGRIAAPGARVVVSWANPRWEPIIELLERLHLKMPEGPHTFHPPREVVALFRAEGFELLHFRDRFPFGAWPEPLQRWFAARELPTGATPRPQLIIGALFAAQGTTTRNPGA
jgi:ubiquinone/menaquinone biosynthesis C-methylase UbiE